MSREWKPGDLAMVTWDQGRFGGRDVAINTASGWMVGWTLLCDEDVSAVRPLVVIDPEDREQVTRVRNACWRGGTLEQWQDYVRSLVTSPKPDEPTGLGAVVEDESQVEFIHLGSGLWAYGTTDGPSKGFRYADISAVRVLSEGVTP